MPSDRSSPGTASGIPLCAPSICGNEWAYVKECLDSGWVSSVGPFVPQFERMVATFVGMPHAVATSSGTAALHIALLTAGVESGDEVLVPTLTFIAPVNAIRYVGAFPVFIDADPVYWQMDTQKVVNFLNEECVYREGKLYNKISLRRVRAILPVHVLGHPVDMEPLLIAAERFCLPIIEDATESLGSTYRERYTGSFGSVNCFSFNGNKIITTGGGGMIVTDDDAFGEKARYLTTQAKDHPLEYIHNEIGYNYRLTNIQAALGVAQMEKLQSNIEAKQKIHEMYNALLRGVPGILLPREALWARSNCWLYTVLVDPVAYGEDSRSLLDRLKSQGIESRPLWRPVHQQRPYERNQAYRIEVANRLYEQGISLPCSVGISTAQIERVALQIASKCRVEPLPSA